MMCQRSVKRRNNIVQSTLQFLTESKPTTSLNLVVSVDSRTVAAVLALFLPVVRVVLLEEVVGAECVRRDVRSISARATKFRTRSRINFFLVFETSQR